MEREYRYKMNEKELANDNEWGNIMKVWIEDDSTLAEIKEINDIIVLAVCDNIDNYYASNLKIYYGYSYFGCFNDSGYLDSLLETDWIKDVLTPRQLELVEEIK